MAACNGNPCTWEAEARASRRVWGQPALHGKSQASQNYTVGICLKKQNTLERSESTRHAVVSHKQHILSKKQHQFVEALSYFTKPTKAQKIDSNSTYGLFEATEPNK